jgi:hypothetical protein
VARPLQTVAASGESIQQFRVLKGREDKLILMSAAPLGRQFLADFNFQKPYVKQFIHSQII